MISHAQNEYDEYLNLKKQKKGISHNQYHLNVYLFNLVTEL